MSTLKKKSHTAEAYIPIKYNLKHKNIGSRYIPIPRPIPLILQPSIYKINAFTYCYC